MMGTLQLAGMRAACDEIVSTGMKRQQGFERVIGGLLKAEIKADRQGRIADGLTRVHLVILDELGTCRSPKPAASCCSTSSAGSTSAPRSSSPPTWPSRNG